MNSTQSQHPNEELAPWEIKERQRFELAEERAERKRRRSLVSVQVIQKQPASLPGQLSLWGRMNPRSDVLKEHDRQTALRLRSCLDQIETPFRLLIETIDFHCFDWQDHDTRKALANICDNLEFAQEWLNEFAHRLLGGEL